MKDLSTKIITVVLELDEQATVEELIDLYKNSTYIHGCKVRAIYDGDLPQLLDECEHNYSELLKEGGESNNV